MPEPVALGLDIGTLNSRAAVVLDAAPELVRDSLGAQVHASAIHVDNARVLAGNAARVLLRTAPELTVGGLKRVVGRPFAHPEVARFSRMVGVGVREGPNGTLRLLLGPLVVSPVAVQAHLLAHLKAQADAQCGRAVTEAVLAVPAAATAAQREAAEASAQQAGFNVLSLVEEPVAAVHAFGLTARGPLRLVVVEFSSASATVCVVEVTGGGARITGAATDANLGGDELDARLLGWLMPSWTSAGITVSDQPAIQARLLQVVEEAKRKLSDVDVARVHVAGAGVGAQGAAVDLTRELTRVDLLKLTQESAQHCFRLVDEALKAAGVTRVGIDQVLMVGGGARLAAMRSGLARYFKKQPLAGVDPEHAVALGAALHGHALMRTRTVPNAPAPQPVELGEPPPGPPGASSDVFQTTAQEEPPPVPTTPPPGSRPPPPPPPDADQQQAAAGLEARLRAMDGQVRRLEERKRELTLASEQMLELRNLRKLTSEMTAELAAGGTVRRELKEAASEAIGIRDELREGTPALARQVRGLQDLVTQLQAQVVALTSETRDAHKDAQQAASTVAGARVEVQSVRGLATQVIGELEDLHIRHDELRDKAPVVEAAVSRLDEVDILSRRTEERMRLLLESYGRVQRMGDQLQHWEAVLESTRRLHQDLVTERERTADLLRQCQTFPLPAVREELRNLLQGAEEVRHHAPDVQRALAQLQVLEARTTALDATRNTVAALEAGLRQAHADLGDLSAARAEQQSLWAGLDNLVAGVDAARQRLASVEESSTLAQAVLTELNTLSTRTDDAQRQVAQLELRAEAALRTGALSEEREQRLQALRLDMAAQDAALADRRTQVDVLLQTLDSARTARAALSADTARVLSASAEATQDVTRLEEAAALMRRAAAELARQQGLVAAAQARCTALQQRMDEAEARQAAVLEALQAAERHSHKLGALEKQLGALAESQAEALAQRDALLARGQDVTALASRLDALAQLTAGVEERLATARKAQADLEQLAAGARDARVLLDDLGAQMELAEEQRAKVDHAITQGRMVQDAVREGEALLKSMQRERNLSERISQAVKSLRTERRGDGD